MIRRDLGAYDSAAGALETQLSSKLSSSIVYLLVANHFPGVGRTA